VATRKAADYPYSSYITILKLIVLSQSTIRRLSTRTCPLPHEHVVEKNVPDAFIQSGLERWLHQRNIKSLVIVGVSTNNSVEATVRSAGNLGFNTIVINDATFAFAKHDYSGRPRTAEEVHDMSLANLDDEYAKIMTTEKLIKDMEK